MSISLFARLHHRFGPPVDRAARRRFLKVSAAATAGTLLSGCRSGMTANVGRGKRVIVVGAGFAGLAAAYELQSVGYDVVIIEARDRISGRVLSFNDRLTRAFVPGKNVEGGGELIGNNHPCWIHYADRFKLSFLDVTSDELESPIVIDGRRIGDPEAARLWDAMDDVFQRMNADARAVSAERPWRSPNAVALDRMSVVAWLAKQRDIDHLTRRACDVQLASDNGVSIDRQSYLGLLAGIKGGDVERYWTDSEVYRCDGGNMQLAHKLADAIGRDRITLGVPVTAIDARGAIVRVTRADGQVVEADDVIVTVPPTIWSRIAISPALPAALWPQMGLNLKYLAHVRRRFWNDAKRSPDSLGEGFCSQTWEGTDAQPGDADVSLNCFSGGDPAAESLAIPASERDARYADELEKRYAGFKAHFVRSRYMDWPQDPWTLAGYSFPAPGQVTTVGPRLYNGLGRMHFAGEHCCYAFVGYMEGALTSGTSLARRIAARDGLIIPDVPMPLAPATQPLIEEKPTTEPSKGPLKTPATTEGTS